MLVEGRSSCPRGQVLPSEARRSSDHDSQNCCAEEKIVRAPHPYAGHGEASVAIIGCELGVNLYPEEASAIIHHMGAFYLQGDELKDYDRALDIYPKQIIAAHTADMLAARFDEGYDHEKTLE